MRTTDAIDLFTAAAKACRLDIDANGNQQLSPREFTDLRTLLSDRLATAWEHHYWPDLIPIEKRYFRPLWDTATAYTLTVVDDVQRADSEEVTADNTEVTADSDL